MYQATTPKYTFTFPFKLSTVKSLLITFKQNNKELNFDENDVLFLDDYKIEVKLTQKQTAMFQSTFKCKVQVRVKLNDDNVIASQIEMVDVNPSLNLQEI